jgi:hypothetical protein
MRIHLEAMFSGIMLVGTVHGVQAQNLAEDGNGRALLSTTVTGSLNASGLGDPQYVLSFVPVQHLMIEAIRHPLTQMEIQKAIQTTPVTLDHLLQLELLRKEGDTYRLNYLLLTIQDQQAMYRASERYGQSLAEAFRSRKVDFDEFVNRYPNVALRPQLMFDLVAGAALNWGGLELTTDLGYRVQPPRHANGDVYLVHSKQVGAQLDFAGLYLDSETAPGSKMSFSTFGDGVSMPRLQGLPDVLDDAFDTAMDPWRNLPEVYAAFRSEYLALLMLAIHDAGQVMNAVADGSVLILPAGRRSALLLFRPRNHRFSNKSLSRYNGFVTIPSATRSLGPLTSPAVLENSMLPEQLLREPTTQLQR